MSVIVLYRAEGSDPIERVELDVDALVHEVTQKKGYYESLYLPGFRSGDCIPVEYWPLWPVVMGFSLVLSVMGLFGFLLRSIPSFDGARAVPFLGGLLRAFDLLSHHVLSWMPVGVDIVMVHGVLGLVLFLGCGYLVYFGFLRSTFRKFIVFDRDTGLVHIPPLFGYEYDVIRFNDAVFYLRYLTSNFFATTELKLDLLRPREGQWSRRRYFNKASTASCVALSLQVGKETLCSLIRFMHYEDTTKFSSYFNPIAYHNGEACDKLQADIQRYQQTEWYKRKQVAWWKDEDGSWRRPIEADQEKFRRQLAKEKKDLIKTSISNYKFKKRYRRYDPSKLVTEPNWIREELEDDQILWRRSTEEDIRIYHDELAKRREKRQAIAQAKTEAKARQQAKDDMTRDEIAAKARERHQRRHGHHAA